MTWDVHLGDCLAYLRSLPDKSVDHVITDPPYGEHVHSKPWQSHALTNHGQHRPRSEHLGIDFEALTVAMRGEIARECGRLARRWVCVFCDIEGGEGWRDDLAGNGLDYVRTCVWDKVDSAPQFTGDRPANGCELFVLAHPPGRKRWHGGGRRNLFKHAVNEERGGKPHPTTKPDALMLEIVSLFTDPGETILDPFAGSGTTGVACLRLGRNFIGCEVDPKYHALATERLRAEKSGVSLGSIRTQRPAFDEVPPAPPPKDLDARLAELIREKGEADAKAAAKR